MDAGATAARSAAFTPPGSTGCPSRALTFERQLKPLWDRMDARHKIQVDRCVVSFSPKKLDPDKELDQLKALEIGRRIAEANAPHCQSAVFVQSDGKGHRLHQHILTNMCWSSLFLQTSLDASILGLHKYNFFVPPA